MPSKSRSRRIPVTLPGVGADELSRAVSALLPTPKPRGKPGKSQFGTADDEYAESLSLLRGVIIDDMDRSLNFGPLRRLLCQDHPDIDVRQWGLDVFQALVVAICPEQFLDPAEVAEPGVIPPGGPRRLGRKRVETVAAGLERLLAAKPRAG